MTAQVIDFAAEVRRRYARELAHRAVQSISVSVPLHLAPGDWVRILCSGDIGYVLEVHDDGRALVKVIGSIASTMAPLSQLVRLDGPRGSGGAA